MAKAGTLNPRWGQVRGLVGGAESRSVVQGVTAGEQSEGNWVDNRRGRFPGTEASGSKLQGNQSKDRGRRAGSGGPAGNHWNVLRAASQRTTWQNVAVNLGLTY